MERRVRSPEWLVTNASAETMLMCCCWVGLEFKLASKSVCVHLALLALGSRERSEGTHRRSLLVMCSRCCSPLYLLLLRLALNHPLAASPGGISLLDQLHDSAVLPVFFALSSPFCKLASLPSDLSQPIV